MAAVATLIVYGLHEKKLQDEYSVPKTSDFIEAALQRNGELSENRQTVVDSAVSLVGKVEYFWGGKSYATGFDELWGTFITVDAKGSESTGTVQAYGLDCSGFVSWCFIQTGLTRQQMEDYIGNGTYNQWQKSTAIKFSDLMPGDLVFQYKQGDSRGNHVGIVIGFRDNGEPLIAHCAASFNRVVITTRGKVFHYARRPNYY